MLAEQSKIAELEESLDLTGKAESLLGIAETSRFADLPRNVAGTNADAASRFLRAEAELDQLRWAVISFDRCEAGNLTYEAAARLLAELEAKGVTGLCIVTDQTAARLAN